MIEFCAVSASETDVVTQADIPEPTNPFELVHTWSVRHRMMDLPDCWDLADEIDDATEDSNGIYMAPVLWGTKIGGVSYSSQDSHEEVPPGYLCNLTSITPHLQKPWSWVDRETPTLLAGFIAEWQERSDDRRHGRADLPL